MLFRSRWLALAWVVFMTVSAVLFATTGTGAVLTGTAPRSGASEQAPTNQSAPNPWDEDDITEDAEVDPAQPDLLPGNASQDPRPNGAPYAGTDSTGSDGTP